VDEPLFYFASAGRGVFITNGVEPLTRLRVPESPSAGQLLIGPGAEAAVKKLIDAIKIKYQPIVLYAMAKALVLCAGIGTMYWRVPFDRTEMVWDITPIVRLVEEAGGLATLADGKPIKFSNDGSVRNADAGILFTNAGQDFHRKVVRAIQMTFE
jgi:3'-phosphoadenosine 5'-phosphosulfate (PAPS) 3'-phosphatase